MAAGEVSGALLAGGGSRRMGRDKRHLDVQGRPLLARSASALAEVCAELTVITSSPQDRDASRHLVPGHRWLVDLRPGQGPLAGIETALRCAAHDLVLVLAGDHPAADPAVLGLLASRLARTPGAHAAVLVTDRGAQPLVAAYHRDALPQVSQLLDGGERRARALLDQLEVVAVLPEQWAALDTSGRTPIDLDAPVDVETYRRAAALDGRVVEVPVVRLPATSDAPPRATTRALTHAPPDAATDAVVVEEPLEVRVCGPGQTPLAVFTTLRTPGHDEELAVGWLAAEGLIGPGDVVRTRIGDPLNLARPENQRTVHLRRELDLDRVVHRHTMATASCGVCGRASIQELTSRCASVGALASEHPPLPFSALAGLPERLRAEQRVFAATGGLHAAGIAARDGRLLTVREDIGRHNALDAAIGAHVLAGDLPLTDRVVVVSGRAGFELVAKAAMAGASVLAAVGAVSDLAVRTAERLGLTLVVFLRDGRGTVATHTDRIDPTS